MVSRRLAIAKLCPNCNKEFHPFNRKQVHCSRECSGQHSVVLTCSVCGKIYSKGAALASRVQHNHYCSIDCKFDNKRTTVTCETCGKEFDRIISWISSDKKNYCSRECANEGLRVKKPILICDFCGKQFERYPSEIKKMSERGYRHVFCCHKCRAAMIATQFNPPKPYRGFTGSTPNQRNNGEYKQWRKAILKRDNYICQDCGVTNVLVCAHHKKAFSLYPELRYDVSNGITLCFPCHDKRHSLP